LPTGGVGEYADDPVTVDVGDPQLRTGVRAFPAQDQPGTRRPTCEVDQSGGLGDPRTVAGFK
jgi:hypothetical protein